MLSVGRVVARGIADLDDRVAAERPLGRRRLSSVLRAAVGLRRLLPAAAIFTATPIPADFDVLERGALLLQNLESTELASSDEDGFHVWECVRSCET